jgi:hypothetical protein
VFADIVNVLIFDGKDVVKEDELENDVTNSFYKADGKLHEQERDVSKFWRNCNFRLALFGLENQTSIDKTMPLRVMGYDGASYRQQLLNKGSNYYPVVTLVLYFGKQRWTKNRTLYECIDVPEELKPYVNDYKINVFEISYLTDKQVNMFKNDFKHLADYYVKKRKGIKYDGNKDKIQHLWETLNLLSVLTGDNMFEKQYPHLKDKEGVSMCEVVESIYNDGVKEGIELGREQGVEKNRITTVIDMYKNNLPKDLISTITKFTIEKINEILKNNNLE